jgi:hypothetical protein
MVTCTGQCHTEGVGVGVGGRDSPGTAIPRARDGFTTRVLDSQGAGCCTKSGRVLSAAQPRPFKAPQWHHSFEKTQEPQQYRFTAALQHLCVCGELPATNTHLNEFVVLIQGHVCSGPLPVPPQTKGAGERSRPRWRDGDLLYLPLVLRGGGDDLDLIHVRRGRACSRHRTGRAAKPSLSAHRPYERASVVVSRDSK